MIYNFISKINKKIIYINSNKLEKNRKNSIYDIGYKDNLIYIYNKSKVIENYSTLPLVIALKSSAILLQQYLPCTTPETFC